MVLAAGAVQIGILVVATVVFILVYQLFLRLLASSKRPARLEVDAQAGARGESAGARIAVSP